MIFQISCILWAGFAHCEAFPECELSCASHLKGDVAEVGIRRCMKVKTWSTGWGVWPMLPSAGQSHSCVALPVPAPAAFYCSPPMLWWLSSLMDSPNILGFPAMDEMWTVTAWALERVSFCSWFTSIFSLPSGFTITPWKCHQESPGSLTTPLHTWETKDVTDLKTCSWLPNPSCPSNSTAVTFSLSFTCKSCGIRNAMLLPSGEDWEGVKPGRAGVMSALTSSVVEAKEFHPSRRWAL